jgi:multiple sugar transport system substrate-binding protein
MLSEFGARSKLLRHAAARPAVILAVLLLILGSLLAACAAPQTAAEPQADAGEAAQTGATVEIQFWDMVWGPPEYVDAGNALIEQFNATHPDIQVTYQSTPWSSWPQVFTTAIGSGTAPDMSSGGGYQAIDFYTQDAILSLNDLVATLQPEGSDPIFLAGSLENLNYEGNYVALPWGFDIRTPYYRTDLFEAAGVEPPTNWDELRAALKAVSTDGNYGIAFAGNSPLGWQQMASFIYNNGGGFFTEDGQLDVLNERNVEALTFISDLIKDGVVHPGSAGFSDADLTRAIGDGSAAMTIYQPGFEKRLPEQTAVITLMAPLTGPHGDKGTMMWANNLMLYAGSEHPEAAQTFLQWYSENQLPMWTQGNAGLLPARASIAADAYFQDDPLIKKTLDEWVPVAKLLGHKNPAIFPELNGVDGSGLLNTLATDILQGMDPVEALTKLDAGLQPIVNQ